MNYYWFVWNTFAVQEAYVRVCMVLHGAHNCYDLLCQEKRTNLVQIETKQLLH